MIHHVRLPDSTRGAPGEADLLVRRELRIVRMDFTRIAERYPSTVRRPLDATGIPPAAGTG